jgi:hypothetical protein
MLLFNISRFYAIMGACLQGATVVSDAKMHYDLRYFYVDSKKVTRCACGVAFVATMFIYREHKFTNLCDHVWYLAVENNANLVVRGCIAEQICLLRIATTGLRSVNPHLHQMDHSWFTTSPDWKSVTMSNSTQCLYLPYSFKFPNIDGIILSLDRTKQRAYLFPLQITLAKDHADSEDAFYTSQWHSWIGPLTAAGYVIQSTFVWIDRNRPSATQKMVLVKETRSGPITVIPSHYSVHVGIGQVDLELVGRLDGLIA